MRISNIQNLERCPGKCRRWVSNHHAHIGCLPSILAYKEPPKVYKPVRKVIETTKVSDGVFRLTLECGHVAERRVSQLAKQARKGRFVYCKCLECVEC